MATVKAASKIASVTVLATPPHNISQDQCITYLALSSRPIQSNNAEKRHIAFLKVHKCASSTLFNIFYRFGQQRHLTFVIPRQGHIIGRSTAMRKRKLFPPPGNKSFDIACLHSIFEKEVYEAYLPKDTIYVAIIREPINRLVSAFWYYLTHFNIPYLRKIPGSDPVGTFLSEPSKYEIKDVYYSHTNNRMALDFGFPPQHFGNLSYFKQYLTLLDSRFDLILDADLFPESIVLLKRKLNWSLKDILYIAQNKQKKKPVHLTKLVTSKAKDFLHLDYILYNHFSRRLREEIRNQDESFKDEVENLRRVQLYVARFCIASGSHGMGKVLVVGATMWNQEFRVDFCDCSYMEQKEVSAVKMMKKSIYTRLKKEGPNEPYFIKLPM
ncbi:galactose-3-O-sulfotransferase 2-like [Haliotis rufescens]|uniref:galactose-3-O-sulfotransferase 2-like n=1 Tax=Haliotis rufescens TaxID=6454 RepID=UPI00201FA879|nr:galactose-3-O-sulfotransferase 2-like [Haliotis rufescens]